MCQSCVAAYQDAALLLSEQLLLADDTGYQGATRTLTPAERRSKIRFGDLDRMEQTGVRAARNALESLQRAAVEAIQDAVGDGDWVEARRLVAAVEALARQEPEGVAREATQVAAAMRELLAETYRTSRTMATREAREQGVPDDRADAGLPPEDTTPGAATWATAAAAVAITPWQRIMGVVRSQFVTAAVTAAGGVAREQLLRTVADVPLDGAVDEARQALHQAIGAGRVDAAQAIGPSAIWASELLDGATCPKCAVIDGQEYATVEQAREDYPLGGYVNCDGGPRCRGTLVFEYHGDEDGPVEPPPSILDDLPDGPPDAPETPDQEPEPDLPEDRDPWALAAPGQPRPDGPTPPLPSRAEGFGQEYTDWRQVPVDPTLRTADPVVVAQGTNPRFEARGREYSNNCTSVVTAYEARRRGLDVTANRVATGEGRTILEWSQFYAHPDGTPCKYLVDTQEVTKRQLDKLLEDSPDGTRYIVQVGWKRTRSGHVFSAEKWDGQVRYVEGQDARNPERTEDYWPNVRGGKATILRTDDKVLTDKALQAVSGDDPAWHGELGAATASKLEDNNRVGRERAAASVQTRSMVRETVSAALTQRKGRKPGQAQLAALNRYAEQLATLERVKLTMPDSMYQRERDRITEALEAFKRGTPIQ